MKPTKYSRLGLVGAGGLLTVLGAALALGTVATPDSRAGFLDFLQCHFQLHPPESVHPEPEPAHQYCGEPGGTWMWMRSPEEERRVIIGLFNRYCIRCHGVDGRGIWDIPCVPDFSNPRWQASRSDAQIVRIVLEGRGAVMPPFRGTLTLEEAWGMARYLRTLVPGSETPKPDLGKSKKTTPEPGPKQEKE
jgi:hypothetical protein